MHVGFLLFGSMDNTGVNIHVLVFVRMCVFISFRCNSGVEVLGCMVTPTEDAPFFIPSSSV